MNLQEAISSGRAATINNGVLTIELGESTLWFEDGQLVMIEDDNGQIVAFGDGDRLVTDG